MMFCEKTLYIHLGQMNKNMMRMMNMMMKVAAAVVVVVAAAAGAGGAGDDTGVDVGDGVVAGADMKKKKLKKVLWMKSVLLN
jgi:hypothetical protein